MNRPRGRLIAAIFLGLLHVNCPFFGPVDTTARAADRIADSIQSGQVGVQVGIDQAIRLAEDVMPGLATSLRDLGHTTVIAAGTQARCTTDLVLTRVVSSIRLLFRKKVTHDAVMCGSDPAALAASDVLTLQRTHIDFGGFDLPHGLKALVVGENDHVIRDVSASLSWNSPYLAILLLNDEARAAVSDRSASRIILLQDGKTISQVGILNALPFCKDEPDTPVKTPPIELRPQSATHGDNDFDGHGPLVDWRVSLLIDSTNSSRLLAHLFFRALEREKHDAPWAAAQRRSALGGLIRSFPEVQAVLNRYYDDLDARIRAAGGALYEPTGDDTDTIAERDFPLYTAPEGYQIVAIESQATHAGQYYDINHGIDTEHPGEPIQSIELVGDTDDDDIGASGIKVSFDAIRIHLKQTSNCAPRPGT